MRGRRSWWVVASAAVIVAAIAIVLWPDRSSDVELRAGAEAEATEPLGTSAADPTVWPPRTTSAPTETAMPEPPPTTTGPPPTLPPDLVIEPMVMPELVGLPDVATAILVMQEACGPMGVVHPTPAWDPSQDLDPETIVHQLPAPGTPLDEECNDRGTTPTAFYTNQEYCSEPEDRTGLGWCPKRSDDPTATLPTLPPPPTTLAPTPTEGPILMPDLVGSSIEEATTTLGAICGSALAGFPSPAWDPAEPAEPGTVIHQLPEPGSVLDESCLMTDGDFPGATPTLFVADPEYCSGTEDAIGLGWCPRG